MIVETSRFTKGRFSKIAVNLLVVPASRLPLYQQILYRPLTIGDNRGYQLFGRLCLPSARHARYPADVMK